VVSDVGQTPKAESPARGEGTAGGDDLVGEAHVTFGGDGSVSSSSGEVGGSGHRTVRSHMMWLPTWHASCRGFVTMTSIMLFDEGRCVELWLFKHSKHSGGHERFILVQTSEPYV
jgi:hypothetical protein